MPLSVSAKWADQSVNRFDMKKSKIYTHRFLGGVGDAAGSIHVNLYNDRNASVNVNYFESIPWILKYCISKLTTDFHTLKVKCLSSDTVIRDIYYQTAIDRVRPNVMELLLTLPPLSVVEISIEFERTFVKITEHYPDENRIFI
jgi:phosphatidylinositol glycan class T